MFSLEICFQYGVPYMMLSKKENIQDLKNLIFEPIPTEKLSKF